ncbi:MAG: uracil-DNA glycosylase [Bdellovibrionaceae bacterium]|nr:uracil-DNA glycosylase [Pseudobdellovibrionaceae bacterium]
MNIDKVQLEESWKNRLISEFKKDYMENLKSFLKQEYQNKKTIFPRGVEFFSALNSTPLDQVKVVIIGQDPYHGPNQAHGLCFSVKPGVKIPPSLVNIYQELKNDIGFKPPTHGYLQEWAEQGVLLLNATLSVEEGRAGSHQNKGWEQFTDKVIHVLSETQKNLVFMLWGSYAQKKGSAIDTTKHLVLKAPHPSPLSAYRGFLGCKHFSKTNVYLKKVGKTPIHWQISENQKFKGAVGDALVES